MTQKPLKPLDNEKITINLGHVDLGRIDLLVQEGFYANRSDFIRTAIRNQLAAEAEAVSRSVERHTLEMGLRDVTRAELEAALAAGETLHIKVVGLVRMAPDISPDLARAAIGSLTVLGALQAEGAIKAALKGRIT
jgi:Arc/MetJ-type ribon-helix-helix transcriptional regulator